jgi:hypothetical protein
VCCINIQLSVLVSDITIESENDYLLYLLWVIFLYPSHLYFSVFPSWIGFIIQKAIQFTGEIVTVHLHGKVSLGNTLCFRFHFLSHPPPGKVHRTELIWDTSHSYLYIYGGVAEFWEEAGRNIKLISLRHSGRGKIFYSTNDLSNLNFELVDVFILEILRTVLSWD